MSSQSCLNGLKRFIYVDLEMFILELGPVSEPSVPSLSENLLWAGLRAYALALELFTSLILYAIMLSRFTVIARQSLDKATEGAFCPAGQILVLVFQNTEYYVGLI